MTVVARDTRTLTNTSARRQEAYELGLARLYGRQTILDRVNLSAIPDSVETVGKDGAENEIDEES